MKRELKARQEANIRGLLSIMEVSQVLRAEQLAGPLQPNLVPVPPLVRAPASSTHQILSANQPEGWRVTASER